MSYDSATFYLDYALGNDAARTALTSCEAANPSGTITRITKAGHGLITGAVVDLTAFTAWLNSAWKITKVDDDNFDLDGAVWQAAADHTGTVTPRGGSGWGTDAWKTMKSGATAARIQPGDIIKIAESGHPTSIGQAKWTNGPIPANITVVTASSGTPIAVHVHGHGLTTGDVVQIYGCTANVGANGVFKITRTGDDDFTLDDSVGTGSGVNGSIIKANSKAVVLATADQTKEVFDCDEVFSAANSGVVDVYNNHKQGLTSCKIGVPASPATGTKYAYFAFAGAFNFADYQKISLWLISSSASMLGTWWKICLCSDGGGNTPVDEFYLPAIAVANVWHPITVTKNGGGNCSNSIRSIAFYTNSVAPTGSTYLYVDNIIACKTSGISLTSLISRNSLTQGGTEPWLGIQSIQRNIALLDQAASSTVGYGTGYFGVSDDDAETYIREPVIFPGISYEGPTEIGAYGKPTQYQGGYNTSTGAQSGETILDFQNAGAYMYMNQHYTILNHVSVVRGGNGIYVSGRKVKVLNAFANNCSSNGFYLTSCRESSVGFTFACNNSDFGAKIASCTEDTVIIRGGKTQGNEDGGISDDGIGCKLIDVTIVEATKVVVSTSYTTVDTRVSSHREGNADGVHYIYMYYGLISSDAVNRHTESGLAWSLAPTNASRTEAYPVYLRIARLICEANVELAISAYMKLSSSTDIGGKIVCHGGQIKGVDNDVAAVKTQDTDWQKLTINITPTEFGIVEIFAAGYYLAGTADEKVYVDDVSWEVVE